MPTPCFTDRRRVEEPSSCNGDVSRVTNEAPSSSTTAAALHHGRGLMKSALAALALQRAAIEVGDETSRRIVPDAFASPEPIRH